MICCSKNFNNNLLNTEIKKDVIDISNFDIDKDKNILIKPVVLNREIKKDVFDISNFDIGKNKNILIKPVVLNEQKVYEVLSEKIILDKKYFIENFCEFIKENYKIIILILIILLILK